MAVRSDGADGFAVDCHRSRRDSLHEDAHGDDATNEMDLTVPIPPTGIVVHHDRRRQHHRPARSHARGRRDDVRLVRGADREEAQPDRRRHRERQLRHRTGDGRLPRQRHPGRPGRRGRRDRLHRDAARARRRVSGTRGVRRDHVVAATAAGLGGAERAGGSAVDGSRAAVRLLAVAGPRARLPRGGLGRVAVPPRRAGQPAPPRRDDGHPHLGRGGRGLPVVGVGAALHPRGHAGHEDDVQPAAEQRQRTPSLSRGRRRSHHLHPRRPLLRGARQAAVRRRAAGAARHGRQGRRGPA